MAALVGWGVALAEYLLRVPANRIGYTKLDLGPLKTLQEVIALSVFVPFAVLSMKETASSPGCTARASAAPAGDPPFSMKLIREGRRSFPVRSMRPAAIAGPNVVRGA